MSHDLMNSTTHQIRYWGENEQAFKKLCEQHCSFLVSMILCCMQHQAIRYVNILLLSRMDSIHGCIITIQRNINDDGTMANQDMIINFTIMRWFSVLLKIAFDASWEIAPAIHCVCVSNRESNLISFSLATFVTHTPSKLCLPSCLWLGMARQMYDVHGY